MRGEGEELSQAGQALGFGGSGAQERFDVGDVDGGPVVFAAVVGEEAGEVAYCVEAGVEGVVAAWLGAGRVGPAAAGEQVFGERCRGRA